MKVCLWCHQCKPLDEYYKSKRNKDGLLPRCKTCEKKRTTKWSLEQPNYRRDQMRKRRLKNPDYFRQKLATYAKNLRDTVRQAYGNKCACCFEQQPMFLSIDHVNNDGNLDKWKNGKRICGNVLYSRIIKEGFPKDRYQLLCMNCNVGKRFNNGICPHKTPVVAR